MNNLKKVLLFSVTFFLCGKAEAMCLLARRAVPTITRRACFSPQIRVPQTVVTGMHNQNKIGFLKKFISNKNLGAYKALLRTAACAVIASETGVHPGEVDTFLTHAENKFFETKHKIKTRKNANVTK